MPQDLSMALCCWRTVMANNKNKTLYEVFIYAKDEFGNPFTYTKGKVTPSKKVATNRLQKGLKGYVQDINTKDIVHQNMMEGMEAVGL